MDLKRTGALLGLAALTTFGLAACSDDNAGGGDTAAQAVSDAECGGKANLNASGSSAQNNAMTIFANSYTMSCEGQTLDYNSNGSGSGVKEFIGGQTDFGGSDSPLKDDEYARAEERCEGPAWNLPAVFGPIAVAYNLDGVDVALSADTIAKIFSGVITNWNDPAIAAENEGVDLPDQAITVIFRSDESGTTDNFQKYLEAAAPEAWTGGAGKTFNGGTGEGSRGNEGVSAAIAQTPGTITYTEWSYAKNQGLGMVNVITPADAEGVELNAETAGTTIDSASLKNEGSNDLVIDTSSFYVPEVEGAYPIIMPTYELVCSAYADPETAEAVKSFLNVAVAEDVQAQLEDEGYIPVPDAFREKLLTAISEIS
ncbi:phosphate ABC transporter substrate-binding protein, PhoT family [Dietzia kunjamensis subsp. schimae]|uniref:Phosphate-binding protein n=1 Tax=Dietzia kunjamensis subsp. schimae TaxID=498198 RepID=A0ABY1MY23_9ACTN|nr:phosphate ABC transporter substrate-binding protein PstS [Dietzia kunjamensis]SMO50904.1 phosphate ABC transporter substrate-binding protein, PhoT family [Dietzia kunjamensis subsp. schimae]